MRQWLKQNEILEMEIHDDENRIQYGDINIKKLFLHVLSLMCFPWKRKKGLIHYKPLKQEECAICLGIIKREASACPHVKTQECVS